jgi:hypothetical protein
MGATTTLSNRDDSGLPSNCGRHHFFFFLPLDLPASDIAIAIACFCGYPSCMRRLMFELIAFLPEPFFNGMGSRVRKREEAGASYATPASSNGVPFQVPNRQWPMQSQV